MQTTNEGGKMCACPNIKNPWQKSQFMWEKQIIHNFNILILW